MSLFSHFFLKDLKIRYAAFFSIAFLVAAGLWAVGALQNTDHFLVIHFADRRSPDFLGTALDVYRMIAIGGAAIAVNLLLASAFYHRIRFLSYLLSYFSAFLSSLLFIGVGVIISRN